MLTSQFGVLGEREWPDRKPFELIGDIALEVLDKGGIILRDDGWADIPFRSNNTPNYQLFRHWED